uniref:Uncharacterized protein n=1 Tax=Triticum urartu TaxID=4572 RepID=A0A8R7PRI7_TRIUA
MSHCLGQNPVPTSCSAILMTLWCSWSYSKLSSEYYSSYCSRPANQEQKPSGSILLY